MENNKSKNIFTKVYNIFKTILNSKKVKLISDVEISKQRENKNDFRRNIEVKENKVNIVALKRKFDEKLIDVKEISVEDKIELLEMYKKEILKNKTQVQQ